MIADDIPRTRPSSEKATKSNAKASDLNTLHIFMFPIPLAGLVTALESVLADRGNRQGVVRNEQFAVSFSGFALRAI